METFESEWLPNIIDHPLTWHRYIDDVFTIWPHNVNFDEFLVRLNNIHPTIKFKFELETHGTLPFLDVKIIRAHGDIKITIYRKQTASEAYIHFFSVHDEQVKLSTISGLFLRAYRICHADLLTDEINHLTTTFIELQYPLWVIEQAHIKARKTYYKLNDTRTPSNTKKYLVMPYSANLGKLKYWLKEYDVELAYKYGNTIGKSLLRNKPVSIKHVGVYTIPCADCPDNVYIGETGRSVEQRVHEHKLDVRRQANTSSIYTHINTHNHTIDFNNHKIIYKSNNYLERRVVESSLINIKNNFNLSEGQFKLGPLLQSFVYKYIRKKLL